jgi:hypothetical protein
MTNELRNRDELGPIIDEKMTALVREMMDANWSAEDVAFAIEDVLRRKWLNQAEALRRARTALPDDFVSDGNEG